MLIIVSELNIIFFLASVWYACKLVVKHVRYFWTQLTEHNTENTYIAAMWNWTLLIWIYSFFAIASIGILWETKFYLLICTYSPQQSLKNSLIVYSRSNLNFQFETNWFIITCLSYLKRSHHDNRKQQIRIKDRHSHLMHSYMCLSQLRIVRWGAKLGTYKKKLKQKTYTITSTSWWIEMRR